MTLKPNKNASMQESNLISRRHLNCAILTSGVLTNSSQAKIKNAVNNQSIPPIQSWQPDTDSYIPFYPIGWYSFGPWARIQELYENGANCALYAGLGLEDWQLGDTKAQMKIAQRLGMKIVLGLDSSVVGRVKANAPSTHQPIINYVKAFKDHPALLGWQLGDEFAADAAPAINATASLLHSLGSKHQTWQVHPHTWSHRDVITLMKNTDVCTFDGYTYLEGHSEFSPTAAARVLAWQQGKTSLIRKMRWAGNINVTQAVGCQCGAAKFRFPTLREYRWNVFSAISTTGARGTMNWIYSYFGGFYRDEEERFFEFRDNVVRPVNLEQQRIALAMSTGYDIGTVSSNGDIATSIDIPPATGPYDRYNKVGRILLFDSEKSRYFLIVTNNEATRFDVKIRLADLPRKIRSLRVTDRYRCKSLQLENVKRGVYKLQDRLNGYDVAIYEFR